jgi:hypothetical protein
MAGGGSRPGERRGGRKRGTINKKTAAQLQLRGTLQANGITPLEYMLRVMRNAHAEPERRDEMARVAAPYMHSKPAPQPVLPFGDAASAARAIRDTLSAMDAVTEMKPPLVIARR